VTNWTVTNWTATNWTASIEQGVDVRYAFTERKCPVAFSAKRPNGRFAGTLPETSFYSVTAIAARPLPLWVAPQYSVTYRHPPRVSAERFPASIEPGNKPILLFTAYDRIALDRLWRSRETGSFVWHFRGVSRFLVTEGGSGSLRPPVLRGRKAGDQGDKRDGSHTLVAPPGNAVKHFEPGKVKYFESSGTRQSSLAGHRCGNSGESQAQSYPPNFFRLLLERSGAGCCQLSIS